jgi:DNA-binding MarR family transcriptional regulator
MGIFDRIQGELEAKEQQEGITPADLLELPAPLRTLLRRIIRHGDITVDEAAEHLQESPTNAGKMLDKLVEKGYLEREAQKEDWIYRIRFGHKRGRQLPAGIWSALGQRIKEEE